MNNVVSRRRFLAAAAAGTTALLSQALGVAVIPGMPGGVERAAAADLRALFANPESARAIGAEYLRQYPAEAAVNTLIELIGVVGAGQDGRFQASALTAMLQRRIAQDFETDTIVQVNGWILSRTESRLCAIWALA